MAVASKLLNYIYLGREKLSAIISDLSSFFYIKVYFFVILGLNLLNWLAAYFINSKASQDLVVLHYNIDFGVNLIGNVKEVYVIPLLGLCVFLINFVLLSFVYRQNKFTVHLLSAGAILVNLFLLMAVTTVYLINSR